MRTEAAGGEPHTTHSPNTSGSLQPSSLPSVERFGMESAGAFVIVVIGQFIWMKEGQEGRPALRPCSPGSCNARSPGAGAQQRGAGCRRSEVGVT